MNRENEKPELNILERELLNLNFRYELAIKDGAVESILADVYFRIAYLEEKIQNLRKESQTKLSYSLPSLI